MSLTLPSHYPQTSNLIFYKVDSTVELDLSLLLLLLLLLHGFNTALEYQVHAQLNSLTLLLHNVFCTQWKEADTWQAGS